MQKFSLSQWLTQSGSAQSFLGCSLWNSSSASHTSCSRVSAMYVYTRALSTSSQTEVSSFLQSPTASSPCSPGCEQLSSQLAIDLPRLIPLPLPVPARHLKHLSNSLPLQMGVATVDTRASCQMAEPHWNPGFLVCSNVLSITLGPRVTSSFHFMLWAMIRLTQRFSTCGS